MSQDNKTVIRMLREQADDLRLNHRGLDPYWQAMYVGAERIESQEILIDDYKSKQSADWIGEPILKRIPNGYAMVRLDVISEWEQRLAAAVEALRLAISDHSTDERQIERLMRHYFAEASGPQEAGEVEQC